jgi:hypothetical protein
MRTRIWTPIGVALVIGGVVSALSVRPLSLEDLCAGADEIVHATVDRVESYWQGQRIETRVRLSVEETWKGSPASTIELTVPGGTVGGVTMVCSEAATFREKDRVVTFLRSTNGARQVYGWFRGQYTVVGGKVREIPNTTLASFRASVKDIVARKGAPR